MAFLSDLSTILSDNLQDDRFAIPAVEFVAFLVDSYIPVIPEGSDPRSANPIPMIKVSGSSTDTVFLLQLPEIVHAYPEIPFQIGKYSSIRSCCQSLWCIHSNTFPARGCSQKAHWDAVASFPKGTVYPHLSIYYTDQYDLAQVRSSAAEYLFMETESEILKYEDWAASPKQLKPQVDDLRVALSLDT